MRNLVSYILSPLYLIDNLLSFA